MAESVNKKLLSALTEGHEKELRSSARIVRTSAEKSNVAAAAVKSSSNTLKSSKTHGSSSSIGSAQAVKCKLLPPQKFLSSLLNSFLNFSLPSKLREKNQIRQFSSIIK
jgi:hypothetical protein